MEKMCLFCGSKLYLLGDGMVKCSVCRKKYSPAKTRRQERLIECFCRDLPATAAAKSCNVSYLTAKTLYDRVRRLVLVHLEESYALHRDEILEYDEYLYLDHVKRRDRRNIFDAHNFLTFDYGGRVYNILMPSLERYKSGFLNDGLDEIYYREFSKFLKIHRIAKLRSLENTIVLFWQFFDEFMKKYKGVDRDNFIYYLKEAEFKFNYPMPERLTLLKTLWFKNCYN